MVSDETAKAGAVAVAETAKTVGKAIDATSGFGGWLKQTLGTIPEDLLGIAGGDWLHQQRQRNVLAMKAKTEEIRLRIGAGPPNAPSPSVVMPLLIGAADESRPELQDLWAALLASALQPDGGNRVRRAFFETLKAMEPDDARLFRAHMLSPPAAGEYTERIDRQRAIEASAKLTGTALTISWDALTKLGLILADPPGFYTTPYGQEFWRACNP
jgi:hypothetical protein